ncbi:MAG TPA: hypothetical protein VK171_10895, partial [Fimbriimonas sp.]|nr:hypothetical protein [Fimbriimonas sp.]
GSPLNQLLYFQVPGWSATGSPGRAIVLIVLGLALLAGVGYDAIAKWEAPPKKKLAIAAFPLVLLALGMNGQRMAVSALTVDENDAFPKMVGILSQMFMPTVLIALMIGAVALVVLVSGKLKSEWTSAPAALVLVPMLTLAPVNGPDLKLPPRVGGEQQRFAFPSIRWSMVATPDATMPPNIASLMRVHDLFGYDSLLDGAFVNKLDGTSQSSPFPPENGNMLLFRGSDAVDLSSLGATIAPTEENPRIKGGTIVEDGYDHQIIRPNPGVTEVLIKDRYFPGMRAQEPATLTSEDGWRKVAVNGAKGDITIHYPGRLNAVAVIIGCILLCVSFVLSRSRQ